MKIIPTTLAALALLVSQMAFGLPAGTVNVNTASAEQLAEALDGVGTSRAQAIVEYREQYGDFVHVEDLLLVQGIGERVLAANQDRIALSEEG